MAPPRIWPVIHIENAEQALLNAAIASKNGVHGVFLIQMEGNDEIIDPIAETIRVAYPSLQLGVNYLSLSAEEALKRALARNYHASWSDRPGVRSDMITPAALLNQQLLQGQAHTYFASVAFKYQPTDSDPGMAAKKAISLGMLPTTSGTATGIAPDIEKLQTMRNTIGPGAPLAVASGVDPDNIHAIAPWVSDILVSTGISSDFYHFDDKRLKDLMRVIQ